MKDIKIFINNPDDKLLEQINEVVSSPAFEGQKIRVMPDCLIEDAEILTNLGFKKIIELDKNDLVANYDPDTNQIYFYKPLNIIIRDKRPTGEKIFRFKQWPIITSLSKKLLISNMCSNKILSFKENIT